MEVDERPTEQYSDIGGLDQQIQEVVFYCYFSVLQVDPNYKNNREPVTMEIRKRKSIGQEIYQQRKR